MIKVIAVINNKGGVGKTTTAVNLAASLEKQGRRVLLVDLDSQGSASMATGVKREDLSPSSAEVLFGDVAVQEAIRSTDQGYPDLMTGSARLAEAERYFQEEADKDQQLKEAIASVKPIYDVILFDCAPSLSVLTTNALVAADAFIVPVTPDYLALEGVVGLSEVVRDVRRRIGRVAPILGVLLTMVPVEPDSTQELIIEKLRGHYGGKVFDTVVHRDNTLEQAPIRGTSVFDYAPNSQGAREYHALAREVAERVDRYGSVYGSLQTSQ